MNNAIATTAVAIYVGIVLVMSLASFVAYGWDKRRAVNGGRRVPESTLQLLALFGGWPGALIGQRQFHHKTKKLSFLIVFWLVVVLHVAIVGAGAAVAHRLLAVDAENAMNW
jgi:uncharacterized membrane protein YsdA (DUF1294 family)